MKRLFAELAFLLCLTFVMAACGTPAATPTKAPKAEITVLAASSLTEAFTQMAKDFEAANPDVRVALSFAGSQDLVAQITAGVQADVFAPASRSSMDTLVEQGLVQAEASRTFAGNRLVVVCSKSVDPAPSFGELADGELMIVIADETVPVGKYTITMLDKITEAGVLPDFKDKFLTGVVSKETNVKLVLQKVELGDADCGVVYATDALTADQSEIFTIDVPDEYNVPATYPVAALKGSANPEAARRFMDYVLSGAGQATLQKLGFTGP